MLSQQATPDLQSHEELLVRLYGKLMTWALRLTANDQNAAEDLVHDVFVQFELSCDARAIHNVEGYLFIMLKNLHLARMRHASQFPTEDLSIVDYESAEIGLLNYADVRQRIQVQEELWRVCQYAALRKETSKAGSVLILRFFHGRLLPNRDRSDSTEHASRGR